MEPNAAPPNLDPTTEDGLENLVGQMIDAAHQFRQLCLGGVITAHLPQHFRIAHAQGLIGRIHFYGGFQILLPVQGRSAKCLALWTDWSLK